MFVEWLSNKRRLSPNFVGFRQRLNEYLSDRKSETGRWKSGWNCTICVYIMSWYEQNSNTQFERNLWACKGRVLRWIPAQMPTVRVFHVVKPLPQFGSGSNPNPEPLLTLIMGKNGSAHIAITSWKWASMERQQCLVLHLGQSRVCATVSHHNHCIGCL